MAAACKKFFRVRMFRPPSNCIRNLLLLLTSCAFFIAIPTFAQTGTTSVRGTILDKTGGAIAAAHITIQNPQLGLERTTTSGANGEYEFLALPPGTYTLTVEKSAFQRLVHTDLQLLVNSPATQDVVLQIGSATQTVEVTTAAVTLNTSDASLGNAFNETQVKELPIESRNVPDLLSLQAGTTYTGNRSDINKDLDTRSGAVNGAHSDQSNITLDGVDVNDETRGYAFTSVLPVSLDSVQEFRVTTSNYNADEGRSSGAQVALVTKSGTNSFHGSLYEYNRNTLTSANDYFVKLAELQSGESNQPLKLIRNIFGASLGGPIWRNRLFFFINFEGYRQAEQSSVVRVVPSAAMRDGIMQYQCADPGACPGGTVQGTSGATYTVASGVYAISPSQLAALDPLHIGASPVVQKYLQSFPLPNDNSQGDGLNELGYRFRGPVGTNNNWYIARMDYKLTNSGNHTLFWRGALRNDAQDGVPYLPGTSPEQSLVDYSKGFTVGYNAVLGPSLVNNFRWGFTRQSVGQIGNSQEPQILFRGLNDNTTSNNSSLAVVRTRTFQVPVHNLIDDLSWLKGKHTLQFGTNIAFIRNPRTSQLSSFSDGAANPGWLPSAAVANTGTFMDPGANGLPAISSSFNTGYDFPLLTILGSITEVDVQYNYKLDGSVLPQGAPLTRHFATDSYEFYVQDSWKIKPNLTLTYGLRYSLLSPPWETNGYESVPTMDLGNWFSLRAQHSAQGIGSWDDPLVSFDLGGPAHGKPGLYNWDYHNFGPRVGIAWSPGYIEGLLKDLFGGPGQSSVRAGFGIVYDRIGQGLLSTFDRRGAFGLSSLLTSLDGLTTLATAPRLTSINTIPTTDLNGNVMFAPPPPGQFPQTFPTGSQAGAFSASMFGLDSSIKTPYSYAIDFSVARELGHNFSIQASYVGRLSHRLLVQEDLAQAADLVDPKTHIDYFTAVQALAKLYRSANAPAPGQVTAAMVGPAAQYWVDMTQALGPGGAYSLDPITTQGCPQFITTNPVQINYAIFSCYSGNETTALQRIDQSGFPDPNNPARIYYANCGQTGSVPNCYVNPQFAGLFAWRSIGTAAYNALQVNLQKHLSQGIQFDLNYTYSKSIDLESDAERVDLLGLGSLGQINNAWRPKQLRGVSDFDTPHQVNANWIVELPFGTGKWIGRDAHGISQALIGGWQLTGIARWTSGFPVSVANGFAFPTDWAFTPQATQIAHAVAGTTKNPDGTVNLFPDPAGSTGIGAFTKTLPGQSGTRNTLRGDGFAGFDLGLAKRWKMPWAESHSLQFRWDVYNVLNLTRFDVQSASTALDSGSFGAYSGLLTNPRVMQFALRYEF